MIIQVYVNVKTMKKSLEKFQDLVEVQYNKIITDKLAKEVVQNCVSSP